MKGWIFGHPNQKTWTQKIYRHSNKFQNPLHQNYKHVKTLEALLKLKPEQVHSLIVFVGNSTFKTQMPENVTYRSDYIEFIKSKQEHLLTPIEEIEAINKISANRFKPSMKTNREHIKHVNNLTRRRKSHANR